MIIVPKKAKEVTSEKKQPPKSAAPEKKPLIAEKKWHEIEVI